MSTFAPEFAQYWLPGQSGDAGNSEREMGPDTQMQQEALEELAERVNAARSVV